MSPNDREVDFGFHGIIEIAGKDVDSDVPYNLRDFSIGETGPAQASKVNVTHMAAIFDQQSCKSNSCI